MPDVQLNESDLSKLRARQEEVQTAEQAEREARKDMEATDEYKAHAKARDALKRAQQAAQLQQQLVMLDYGLEGRQHKLDLDTGTVQEVDRRSRR